MKKLITVAAAMLGTMLGAITLSPQSCTECGSAEVAECDVVAFKLTASGKTTSVASGYKAVKSLKITKGMLVLTPTASTNNPGACCYSTADIYAVVKVGKETREVVFRDVDVTKWSMFGKYAEDVQNYLTKMKKGSSRKLDSDLGLRCDGDVAWVDGESASMSLCASGFGSIKATNCKGSKSSNKCCETLPGECTLDFKPGVYSGAFSGAFDVYPELQICFNCECGTIEVVNGTWKARYDAKIKTAAAAQAYVFGKALE